MSALPAAPTGALRPTLGELLKSLHNPDAAQAEGHVGQIWEDLECTMTKSGPLLGQRNLHMQTPGIPLLSLPAHAFPCSNGSHHYIYVSCDQLETARATLLAWVVEYLVGQQALARPYIQVQA